jgi:hypothetical protein
VQQGTFAELQESPASAFVTDFLTAQTLDPAGRKSP